MLTFRRRTQTFRLIANIQTCSNKSRKQARLRNSQIKIIEVTGNRLYILTKSKQKYGLQFACYCIEYNLTPLKLFAVCQHIEFFCCATLTCSVSRHVDYKRLAAHNVGRGICVIKLLITLHLLRTKQSPLWGVHHVQCADEKLTNILQHVINLVINSIFTAFARRIMYLSINNFKYFQIYV